jgi:hypothetical protein
MIAAVKTPENSIKGDGSSGSFYAGTLFSGSL